MDPPRRPGAAGGTVKPLPGGSRGLPGPRPPRHLEWLPAAAAPAVAVAAAGSHSVVPTSPTTLPIAARCVPATCVQIAYTVSCVVSCVVSEREKGRGGRGRHGKRRGTKTAGGCSATCVPQAQGPGQQGAARRRGSGRDASRIVPRSVCRGGKGRTGTGRQRARDQEAWEGGQGRTKEGEQTGGKGGRGRASRQGAGQGQGAGAERGGREGAPPRELLRIVLALSGGQRDGDGRVGKGACHGGMKERTWGRSKKVPHNRASRPQCAGALNKAGRRGVLPQGSPPPKVQCPA